MNPNAWMFLSLVRHDARLSWRGLTSLFREAAIGRTALGVMLGAVLLHALAWPAAGYLTAHLHRGECGAASMTAVVGGVFTWMIAQSVFASTRLLYDRGDLVLLLGAPLGTRLVMAAKAIAIMAGTVGSVGLLLFPLANMGAIVDAPVWLNIYPLLMSLAIMATSLGLGLSVSLFLIFGPRRARLYAHMAGAGIGGAFVLSAQLAAMLPREAKVAAEEWIAVHGFASTGALHRVLMLPVDALRGDWISMAILATVGLGMFGVAMGLLGERFVEAVVAAGGAPETGRATRQGDVVRFRGGVDASLRLKEWRLLARDPALSAQLGLQIVYTLPIAVVLVNSRIMPTAIALVPALVMIAAQVAGSIAWITVSGEDAPELIATAPVSGASVEWAKLGAVGLPVLTILCVPLAALAIASWWAAAVALVFATLAGASSALINLWHPMPGNRRGMLRRHSQSKVIGLIEHGLAGLWAMAVVLSLFGTWLSLVPMTLVGVVLFLCRARSAAAGHRPRPWGRLFSGAARVKLEAARIVDA